MIRLPFTGFSWKSNSLSLDKSIGFYGTNVPARSEFLIPAKREMHPGHRVPC